MLVIRVMLQKGSPTCAIGVQLENPVLVLMLRGKGCAVVMEVNIAKEEIVGSHATVKVNVIGKQSSNKHLPCVM